MTKLNLNLPGTPYTSRRVLHGVRVEMSERKIKKNEENENNVEIISKIWNLVRFLIIKQG